MEAFEKWFEEMSKKHPTVAFQPCDGWKAALEWILRDEDAYCCGDWNDFTNEWKECPMTTVIEKELKDS